MKNHAVDAEGAVMGNEVAGCASVINDQVFVRFGEMQKSVVTGAVRDAFLCFENGDSTVPSADGGIGYRIVYVVRAVGPASRRPHEVVFSAVLDHAGGFHIVARGDLAVVFLRSVFTVLQRAINNILQIPISGSLTLKTKMILSGTIR